MVERKGGDVVVETLEALGVEHVFGIASIHNLPIVDAMARRGTITFIDARHEQNAAHSADAYARATGKLGVVLASTGPGAANTIGGLFEAGFASSPVMLITGQAETTIYGKGKGSLHENERQVAMLASVCRRVETVWRTDDISRVLIDVARDITTGRPQPGAVEIPIDLQHAKTAAPVPEVPEPVRLAPDDALLDAAADLLKAASKPLIWSGGGVRCSGATAELIALAELLGAPVVTSPNGRGGIPEDHDHALGASPDRMGKLFAETDVILAVGSRFQSQATLAWQLPLGANLIHIDADPHMIGLNYPAKVGITSDAKLGLAGLIERLSGHQADSAFLERARVARAAVEAGIRDQAGPDHLTMMDAIRELLPETAPMVRDSTVPAYVWANRLLTITDPRTSMHPTGAAIGPGLPFGIGAAVGSGEPTIVIQGDGGVMLAIGELPVAVQHQLPLVLCIFNDRGYGILRKLQDRFFGEGNHNNVDLVTPDFAALAVSMGAAGEAVGSADDFRPALERALARKGPTVLDIDITAMHPMSVFPAPPKAG